MNITIRDVNAFGNPGSMKFTVASGTTSSITPNMPVAKTLGNSTGNVVSAAADATPVVGTDWLAGIAMSTSTETASAAGTVDVMKLVPDVVYLCDADDATLIATQADYDALVGARVVFTESAGTYTIDLTDGDGSDNGLVVQPSNILLYPGKVAFSIRNAVDYFA